MTQATRFAVGQVWRRNFTERVIVMIDLTGSEAVILFAEDGEIKRLTERRFATWARHAAMVRRIA